MPIPHRPRLSRCLQPLRRVLADRLQHAVTSVVEVRVGERLVDEAREQVEHLRLVHFASGADDFGRVERPAAREDRQAPEQHALFGRQQVVTPVDQRAQGALARQRGPASPGEESQAVAESRGDRVERHRAHARGGELDRQGDAVEVPADLDDGRRVRVAHAKRRQHRRGALDEEPHRGKRDRLLAITRLAGVRDRHRRHRVDGFARNPHRFAARREDGHPWRVAQQPLRQPRAGLEHVLAVVEDQQHGPVAQVRDERVDDRQAALLPDAERRRDRLRHEARIRDRRELDEPRAVGEAVEHVGRELERQPRLADAPGAEQRQQARPLERLPRFVELVLAPDERRRLNRQVVGRAFQRAQRREVAPQRWMEDLVEPFGTRQVAQADEAEVAQRDVLGQPSAHQVDHRLREQHLAAVCRAHDARGAVDRGPEVVVVASLRGANVDATPRLQRARVACRRLGEPAEERERRIDRVARIPEHCAHPVARHLDDRAAARLDGAPRQRVVPSQRHLHARGLAFPEPAAALDVREQERLYGLRVVHGSRRSPGPSISCRRDGVNGGFAR